MDTDGPFRRMLLTGLVLALVIIFFRGDVLGMADAEDIDETPPVAHAGDDRTIEGPATVTLDGSGSSDDVAIASYHWSFEYDGKEVVLEGVTVETIFDVHGEYEVTLEVSDAAGNVATDSMTMTVVTPPGRIESLMAIPRNNWVELGWSEPVHDGGSPVTGCVVYRGTSPDALEPYYSDWWIRYWSWDYLAENGNTYYYAVRALNDVGMGPLSPVVNATPIAVPESPQNVVIEVEDGKVHISWEAPEWSSGRVNVTGYQVHRGTDPDWLYDTFDVGNATSFVDDTVEDGRIYYYAIGALSSLGGGAVSEVQEVPVGAQPQEEDDQGWVTDAFAIAFVVIVLVAVFALLGRGLRSG